MIFHLMLSLLTCGLFTSALALTKRRQEPGQPEGAAFHGVAPEAAIPVRLKEGSREGLASAFPYTTDFWESDKDATIRKYRWPELQKPHNLAGRTRNVGVAISGGGTRSWAAGFGQLRALHHLGYLRDTRYLAGVSAGAEVVAAYVYHQTGNDDAVLLGSNPEPSSLSLEALNNLASSSLGYGATIDAASPIMTGFIMNSICRNLALPQQVCGEYEDPGQTWTNFMKDVMKPYGIDDEHFFTLDEDTREKIVNANPHLQASDFILPAATDRPYMILGITGMGPIKEDCLKLPSYTADYSQCLKGSEKRFQRIEATSLYTGFPLDRNLTVVYADDSTIDFRAGGLVESFAFNGAAPNTLPLIGIEGTKGTVELPAPSERWTLLDALSSATNVASIYWYEYDGAWTRPGPGDSVSVSYPSIDMAIQPMGKIWDGASLVSARLQTWNTGDIHPETNMIGAADGVYDGALLGLSDLIVRGVDKAVVFMNTDVALCNSALWDPQTMTAVDQVTSCIDHYVARLFGFAGVQDLYGDFDRSIEQLQMFHQSDFASFVSQLQLNAESGKTAVAKMSLTTVMNTYLGIDSGSSIELVMFYLSSSPQFESELPQETQEEIGLGEDGKFPRWPLYDTVMPNKLMSVNLENLMKIPPESPIDSGVSSLTATQVNLLAGLTTWAVNQNADILESIWADS